MVQALSPFSTATVSGSPTGASPVTPYSPSTPAKVRGVETVAAALSKFLTQRGTAGLRLTGRKVVDTQVETLHYTKTALQQHLSALSVTPIRIQNPETPLDRRSGPRRARLKSTRQEVRKEEVPRRALPPTITFYEEMEGVLEELHQSRDQVLHMNEAIITQIISRPQIGSTLRSVLDALRSQRRRPGRTKAKRRENITTRKVAEVEAPERLWEKGKFANPFLGAKVGEQHPALLGLEESDATLYKAIFVSKLRAAKVRASAMRFAPVANPKRHITQLQCYDISAVAAYVASVAMRTKKNTFELFCDECQIELHPATRTLSHYLLFADTFNELCAKVLPKKKPQAPQASLMLEERTFVLLILSYCEDMHKTMMQDNTASAVQHVLNEKLLPYCATLASAASEDPADILMWRERDVDLDDYLYVREGVVMRIYRSFVTTAVNRQHDKHKEVGTASDTLSYESFLRFARYFGFYPSCMSSFAIAKIVKAAAGMSAKSADTPDALTFQEFLDSLVLIANNIYTKFEMVMQAGLPSNPTTTERVEAFFQQYIRDSYSRLTGHAYDADIEGSILEKPVVQSLVPAQGYQGDVLKLTGQDFCAKRGVKVMFLEAQQYNHRMRRQERRRRQQEKEDLGVEVEEEEDTHDSGSDTDPETVTRCTTVETGSALCCAPKLSEQDMLQRKYVAMSFVSPLIAELDEREDSGRIGALANAMGSVQKSSVVCEIRATWKKYILVSNNRIWVAPTVPNMRTFTYHKLLARMVFGYKMYRELCLIYETYATSRAMTLSGWRALCRDVGVATDVKVFSQCAVDLRVPGSKSYEKALRVVDMISALLLLICTNPQNLQKGWDTHPPALFEEDAPKMTSPPHDIDPTFVVQLMAPTPEPSSTEQSSALVATGRYVKSIFCQRHASAPGDVLTPDTDLLWPLVTNDAKVRGDAPVMPNRTSRLVSYFMEGQARSSTDTTHTEEQEQSTSLHEPLDEHFEAGGEETLDPAEVSALENRVVRMLEKELQAMVAPLVARINSALVVSTTEQCTPALAVPTSADAEGCPRNYKYHAAHIRNHDTLGTDSAEKDVVQEIRDTLARSVVEYDVLVGPRWVGTLNCAGDPAFASCDRDTGLEGHVNSIIASFGSVDTHRALHKLRQFGYLHVPCHPGLRLGHRDIPEITRCWELHWGLKSLGYVWEYPGTITCSDWVAVKPVVCHPTLTIHLSGTCVSSYAFLRTYSIFRTLPDAADLRFLFMVAGITVSTVLP